jgi:N,N'-diacetyllegionaminate synthase
MKLWNKNLKKEIVLVAEIGVNHEGSVTRAKKIISDAKKGGADAVKLQVFTPEKYISSDNKVGLKRINKFFLSKEKVIELVKFCKKKRINVFFTPITEDWVNFCANNSEVIKIASGDLNSDYLIKKVLKKNKKIILSTGLSSLDEINRTVNLIKKYKKKLVSSLILLHCVSEYPVPSERAQLNSIKYLKKKFKLTIGYSNHVKDGILACITAAALGAKVIEFHFTDNKNRKFRDHQLSLDVKDLLKLRSFIDNQNKMLGFVDKKVNKFEKKNKLLFQKGLIASKNIAFGESFNIRNIGYARSALYFTANQIGQILKKKSKRNIYAGELIKTSDII